MSEPVTSPPVPEVPKIKTIKATRGPKGKFVSTAQKSKPVITVNSAESEDSDLMLGINLLAVGALIYFIYQKTKNNPQSLQERYL